MPHPNPPTPSSSDELSELRATVAGLSARVAELERRSGEARPPSLTSRADSKLGLTLVNRVGALTLAIGIIFFFKYAVDNKWIGAEGRVALGVSAGLLMLFAAEWQRRRASVESVFSQGLAGCGLAIIYVALYASVGLYELIVPVAGWVLLVLVSGLGVVLSVRYASSAIAALGFAGALLTPMLLHSTATAWWFDFFYLLVLSMTALSLAMRQNWQYLIPSVAALACLAAAIVLNTNHAVWFTLFALILASAHFIAFRRVEPASRSTDFVYLTAHGCFLIAVLRGVALFTNGFTSPEDRFSFLSALESACLAIYGTAVLVYGLVRKSLLDRTMGLVLLALVILKLYLWDVWQLNRFYRISAFVALGILLLAASYLFSRFRTRSADRP